jgi:secondary thiamine-phosphate synthase enzyme
MQQVLQQAQESLTLQTSGQGLYELTCEVVEWTDNLTIETGMMTLFCRHTSASLIIQENADPDVMVDLENFFKKLVPEDLLLYRHTAKGSDDMPAHIKGALTQTTLNIPIADGRLALGTWQGIFLFEHRVQAHTRNLILHAVGE